MPTKTAKIANCFRLFMGNIPASSFGAPLVYDHFYLWTSSIHASLLLPRDRVRGVTSEASIDQHPGQGEINPALEIVQKPDLISFWIKRGEGEQNHQVKSQTKSNPCCNRGWIWSGFLPGGFVRPHRVLSRN